ncbi:MAG TPA: hypothetical protein VHN74_13545 [Candidatus Angelobacter sp.]|jgi:hypothetical protein|nr:hypothetical protein [Candidatus Angelobacter sp.]
MSPDLLARSLQEFLAEARSGVVLEDDQVIFDLAVAQHSISADRGRCLLHLWSEERNIVRHVLEAEAKNGSLILSVRRFGQNRPHKLELCRDRDRRSQSARTAARKSYARLLEFVLRRQFPDWKLDRLSTTMDLERSFSPVYARGLLRKGRSAMAVLGVNQQETQASVDAALTFGLLWLDHCREREAGNALVEGLKLFVPRESSTTLRIRMAQLNHEAAKFQLFEFDERDESLSEIDSADTGNINTRLVRCPDRDQTRGRFQQAISRVLAEVQDAEVAVLSPTEISFRLHGLEFARVRLANLPGSFEVTEEFVFGVGGYQAPLTGENNDMFRQFCATVRQSRTLEGYRRDPLWRMYPERWLESLVFRNVAAIDGRLDPTHVFSQVPAFSASDRAMIDVLARTREGRLAVIELKADEDIHLPLQGLDYWARVKWHHQRGEFQAHGYFACVELSPKPPLLLMVAPALRVHPSIDTVLRYFSPQIEWMLIGVDERWREGVKVVFRKAMNVGQTHRAWHG